MPYSKLKMKLPVQKIRLTHSKRLSRPSLKRRQKISTTSYPRFLQTLLKFYLSRARSNLSFRRSILLKQASMTRKMLLKELRKPNQSNQSCFRKSKLASITQSSLVSTMYVQAVTKISQKNTKRRLSKTLMQKCWTTTQRLVNLKLSSPILMKSYLESMKYNRRLPIRILNYLQETQQSPCSINRLKKCRLKLKAQKLIRQISMKRSVS